MKKMNNCGWGLNELLAGLGVISFCLVLVVMLYNSKFKNLSQTVETNFPIENYTYKDMEKELEEAAKNYVEKEYGTHVPSGSMKVTMQELQNENLYAKIKDPTNKDLICKGYVIIDVGLIYTDYTPYIKCGKSYETKGYAK